MASADHHDNPIGTGVVEISTVSPNSPLGPEQGEDRNGIDDNLVEPIIGQNTASPEAPLGPEQGEDQNGIDENHRERNNAGQNGQSDIYWDLCHSAYLFIYASIYMWVVAQQSNSHESFHVSKAHLSLLPPGYIYNGQNFFYSDDDIYKWINGSIIQPFWGGNYTGKDACTYANGSTCDFTVGKGNRILLGLLVEQERFQPRSCHNNLSRVVGVQNECLMGNSLEPFGSSPQNRSDSVLYCNPLTACYPPSSKCKDFTKHAFESVFLKEGKKGFAYLFDVNLTSENAFKLLAYLKDGYFIDQYTSIVRLKLLTYNYRMKLFTLVTIPIHFEIGGSVAFKANVKTFSTHISYEGYYGLLISLLVMDYLILLTMKIINVRNNRDDIFPNGALLDWKMKKAFISIWNSVKRYHTLTTLVMISGLILWHTFVDSSQQLFRPVLHYDAYKSLSPCSYWELESPKSLISAISIFDHASTIRFRMSVYVAFHGFIGFVLILRFYSKVQNVFDAFRRFGEKLSKALLSLLVFGIVWSITICTFSWIGYMVFGDVIYQFSSYIGALNYNFRVMLGENSLAETLFHLNGNKFIIGLVYWWSYNIVMVVFLLNVIIGIFVAAYKEESNEGRNSAD